MTIEDFNEGYAIGWKAAQAEIERLRAALNEMEQALMANDRMWLVHVPSGDKALIAKNWGDECWVKYVGPRRKPFLSLKDLLDKCGYDTGYEIRYEKRDNEGFP